MAKSICIVDGAYGIYVPQRYAVMCSAHDMLTDEQREILEAGPHTNPDEYWEVWDEVLGSVEVKRGNSMWHLELSESGDVLLVENN
jgi:hypothetical protein